MPVVGLSVSGSEGFCRDRLSNVLLHHLPAKVFFSRNLAGGCFYSAVARCIDGAIVLTVVNGLGAAIRPRDALGTLSVAALAGGLSQLPGGVGVADGGMAMLLMHYGISGEMAIVAAVIARTFTWWLSVLVGFGVYVGVRKRYSKGQ